MSDAKCGCGHGAGEHTGQWEVIGCERMTEGVYCGCRKSEDEILLRAALADAREDVRRQKDIIAKACIDFDAERQRIASEIRLIPWCECGCMERRLSRLADRIANADLAEVSR